MGEQPVAGEKLFVRKATGLVREIGLLTSILIVLSFTIGLGWQKRVFQFSGPAIVPTNQYFLGINPMVMAFLLVGVVILFSIYAFGALTAAMPRSGGGYVAISRLHGCMVRIFIYSHFIRSHCSSSDGSCRIPVPIPCRIQQFILD